MIGTALTAKATKVLFCGAGELGREVVIAMQRLGVETIAVDRYPNAPGMQAAHRSHVINMLDGKELRRVIELEKPDFIVPEVEAIATDTLVELEKEGFHVIPTARATRSGSASPGTRRSMSASPSAPSERRELSRSRYTAKPMAPLFRPSLCMSRSYRPPESTVSTIPSRKPEKTMPL